MVGPRPAGFWSSRHAAEPFQHLVVGRRYRVARPFTDHDGGAHAVGETWTFCGHAFLPYDSGLSLFVSLDGAQEWHVRLWWGAAGQGDVVDRLTKHVVAAGS